MNQFQDYGLETDSPRTVNRYVFGGQQMRKICLLYMVMILFMNYFVSPSFIIIIIISLGANRRIRPYPPLHSDL